MMNLKQFNLIYFNNQDIRQKNVMHILNKMNFMSSLFFIIHCLSFRAFETNVFETNERTQFYIQDDLSQSVNNCIKDTCNIDNIILPLLIIHSHSLPLRLLYRPEMPLDRYSLMPKHNINPACPSGNANRCGPRLSEQRLFDWINILFGDFVAKQKSNMLACVSGTRKRRRLGIKIYN